jgi:hypothetical protein
VCGRVSAVSGVGGTWLQLAPDVTVAEMDFCAVVEHDTTTRDDHPASAVTSCSLSIG